MLIAANGSNAGVASELGGIPPGEEPGPSPGGRGLPDEGRGLPRAMLLAGGRRTGVSKLRGTW